MGDRESARIEQLAPDLDHVARRLNDICRSATFDLTFRIGELIIEELFVGCPQLWEKHGVRSHSYRSLAARGDLMLSASALCRAVGVYALVEQLGGIERWQHLSASHFQEVLCLDAESRKELLASAEANHWTVSRIRSEVRRLRGERSGKSANDHARTLKQLGLRLTSCQKVLGSVDVSAVGGSVVRELRHLVYELHDQLAQISTALEESAASEARHSHVQELIDRSVPVLRNGQLGST